MTSTRSKPHNVAVIGAGCAGTLSLPDCLRSLHRATAAAVFAWDDPWPALLDLPLVAARIAKRRLMRSDRNTSRATIGATVQ